MFILSGVYTLAAAVYTYITNKIYWPNVFQDPLFIVYPVFHDPQSSLKWVLDLELVVVLCM